MSDSPSISKLLVPLDGSDLAEQAVPYAAALAGSGGELVLLQVIPAAEPVRDLLGKLAMAGNEGVDTAVVDAKASLERSLARWQDLSPAGMRIEVVAGDPATEIGHAAERFGCDLIVAASHGRGALGRLAFGSVADSLARTTSRPVMIVRPVDSHAEAELPLFGRVIVPYDGSALAAEAFPLARAIASRLQTEIHLIWANNPISTLPMPATFEPPYSGALLEATIEESETQAEEQIAAARTALAEGGLSVTSEVVMGTPFEVIVEQTKREDLIVMASHGRHGFQRWLLGSIAERLVREAPAPVVVAHGAG